MSALKHLSAKCDDLYSGSCIIHQRAFYKPTKIEIISMEGNVFSCIITI
jgi:hypothetical protein